MEFGGKWLGKENQTGPVVEQTAEEERIGPGERKVWDCRIERDDLKDQMTLLKRFLILYHLSTHLEFEVIRQMTL